MTDLFAEGGWTMFPTALFGMLAMGAASLVAIRPEKRFVPLVIALSAMTLSTALLGSVIGVLGVVKAGVNAAPTDMREIIAACATQALSSLLVAFACLSLAGLGSAAGALRHAMKRA